MADPIAVVELGDSWAKLLVLLPRGSQWQVGKVVCAPAGPEKQISAWIQEQLGSVQGTGRFKGRTPSLIALIPRQQLMVRHLSLPSQDPDEIAKMISLQVPSLVPYTLQEAVWSSQILRVRPNGYAEVIVAVVLREVIDRLLRVLKPAHLPLERVSISSLGGVHWLRGLFKQKLLSREGVTLLVDLDANTLEIDLVEEGVLLFSRVAPVAPQADPEELVAEIQRTLAAAAREIYGKQITQVVLTGVSSSLEPLAQGLRSQLGVSVETVETFTAVTQSFPSPTCSFTALLGLALEFGELSSSEGVMSLLPPEFLAQRSQRQQRVQWMTTGLLLAGVLVTGMGAVGWPLVGRQLQMRQLEAHLEAIEPMVTQVEEMRQQIQVIERIRADQRLALRMLKELYAKVPSQVALTLVSLDSGERLLLKGQAQTMSEVFALVNALEGSALFDNVQVRYTNKRQFQNQEIADFEIQCSVTLTSKVVG